MFKKLLILLMAAFLLTGCLDMSNRYPEPADEAPAEDVVEEDAADEADTEEIADEEISDDEPADDETPDEASEDEVDEEEPADEEADESDDEMTDEDDQETTEEAADNSVFVQAFLTKYPDWEERLDTLEVTVNSNDDDFASGSVRFTDSIGGGGWFAANADDGWVIAWDGNGTIGCAEIEPYDFPASIIPECWDDENQVIVTRGAEGETIE